MSAALRNLYNMFLKAFILALFIQLAAAYYSTDDWCAANTRDGHVAGQTIVAKSQAVEYNGNGFDFFCYQGRILVSPGSRKHTMSCPDGTTARLDSKNDKGFCESSGCQCVVSYLMPEVQTERYYYTEPVFLIDPVESACCN